MATSKRRTTTPSKLRDKDLEAMEARIQERTLSYIAASEQVREIDPNVRADLARQAACLFETWYRLTMEKLIGVARAEELRTLPNLHSAYRRVMTQIGLDSGEEIQKALAEL